MIRGVSQVLTIIVSYVLAILADIFPLPAVLVWFRPEWVCLVTIHWVLRFPHHVGMGTAWLAGFALDIIGGGIWGGNALALAVVAYICQMAYQRLRSYSLYQQALWVFVLVGVYQLFFNWIQALNGYSAPVHYMLISTTVSAACWPVLTLIMGWWRHQAVDP